MNHASDYGFASADQHPPAQHIDADISDLFFNTDLSVAEIRGKGGKFVGYNDAFLLAEATTFAETFERASGIAVDPRALVRDFLDRL